jgi:hypothetical protein
LRDDAHIESFFTDLRDTHVSGVGVKETSYHPWSAASSGTKEDV